MTAPKATPPGGGPDEAAEPSDEIDADELAELERRDDALRIAADPDDTALTDRARRLRAEMRPEGEPSGDDDDKPAA